MRATGTVQSSLVMFRALKTSFRRTKLRKRQAFAQKSSRRAWAGELATMKYYALCIIYCANTLLSRDNLRTKGQAVGIVHCEICIIYCALCIVHCAFSIVHCALSIGHVVMSIVQCACIVHYENELPMGNGD